MAGAAAEPRAAKLGACDEDHCANAAHRVGDREELGGLGVDIGVCVHCLLGLN